MHRFFVKEMQVQDKVITIIGQDVNHIKNVLRMKINDEIIISTGQNKELYCIINKISSSQIEADVIKEVYINTELSSKIYLFQGLPKSDKMDFIIQKAVELGAYEIVPIVTNRTIVKLDEKKEHKKLDRWMGISESAAKQSNRAIVPNIKGVMTFKEAVEYSRTLSCNIIPYEKADNMETAKDTLEKVNLYQSIGIFIGPEGGFEESEIDLAMKNNIIPISLGKRILRTETAGLAILSVIMFRLEGEKGDVN